jgi:hypothetical protein
VTPTVIDQLNREWARLADDDRVARRVQHVCEVAGGAAGLRDLQRYVEAASPADADRVLVALVGPASAGAELEARVLLQLLMPAVRRLIRRSWTVGDRDERAAVVLAAVWQQITSYRLDRRPHKVALNIVMDARKHLRRLAARSGPGTEELSVDHPAPEPDQPAAVELAEVLSVAVAEGVLTAAQAHLIAAYRISGTRLTDFAVQQGAPYRTVKRWHAHAERALLVGAAA